MVVTHPMSSSVRMNVAQMQEAAKAEAFLELVYVPTLTSASINRKAFHAARARPYDQGESGTIAGFAGVVTLEGLVLGTG